MSLSFTPTAGALDQSSEMNSYD
ncbi:protein of unknown function [Pseudomonas sp. JV241A]|nr:protein of unknown function [Pseudomonas sp. JV241A]